MFEHRSEKLIPRKDFATCAGHDVKIDALIKQAPIFNGLFVLYARLVFVTMVAIMMAPLLRRILHRLHLQPGGEPDE